MTPHRPPTHPEPPPHDQGCTCHTCFSWWALVYEADTLHDLEPLGRLLTGPSHE